MGDDGVKFRTVPILPIDEEAERLVDKMMARAVEGYTPRRLVYWADCLAANLALAGFGCEAFKHGVKYGEWLQFDEDLPRPQPFRPGCGRPAPKKGG